MRRKKIKRIFSFKLDLKYNFHQFRLGSLIFITLFIFLSLHVPGTKREVKNI